MSEDGSVREAIRVVVVDDHASYAEGIRALLHASCDDIRVVGIATTADDGLRVLQQEVPDIALMDIRMPRKEGLEVAKKVVHLLPSVKVVMLTASDDNDDVRHAMQIGVRGYLSKEIDPDQLVAALRAITAGETVVAPFAASMLFAVQQQLPLSEEEIYIVKRLADGVDVAQLAKEICVSESTLKRSVRTIQQKLQVDNRAQALVRAAKKGLI